MFKSLYHIKRKLKFYDLTRKLNLSKTILKEIACNGLYCIVVLMIDAVPLLYIAVR